MPSDRYRQVAKQSLAVDFIENRMPNYHPAYNAQMANWSPSHGKFVAQASLISSAVSPSHGTLDVPSRPPPRPPPGLINDMLFWEDIFPTAMQRLDKTTEPKYRNELRQQWSIRHTLTWPDIQAKLEMAQQDYNFRFQQRHIQSFRRTLRRVFEKVDPYLSQGLKAIPHIDTTTAVLTVVSFVLDVSVFFPGTANLLI
jgi:hypothetical protein